MNLQVVVLPEPDTPTRVTKLPLHMEWERSFTAKLRPPSKDFVTRSSSISAVRCGPHKDGSRGGGPDLSHRIMVSRPPPGGSTSGTITRISANASVGGAVTVPSRLSRAPARPRRVTCKPLGRLRNFGRSGEIRTRDP